MSRTEANLAAQAAIDAANDRGADAWSPSRAREALRAHGFERRWRHDTAKIEARLEAQDAFRSAEEFRSALFRETGTPALL